MHMAGEAHLGDVADGLVLNRPHGADGALQQGLLVQQLEVPRVAQQHLPGRALAGVVEVPAGQKPAARFWPCLRVQWRDFKHKCPAAISRENREHRAR